MQSVRQVQSLNAVELEKVIPPSASWHTDYRDSAYIYIGGLPFTLSEGDVLAIFSQYGNPVHIRLVREPETGKSRGFCFLKYADQRSCDVAVDNLSGATVLGRVLAVDHARYELKEGELEGVGDEEEEQDGVVSGESEGEGEEGPGREMLREELELERLLREHDEDDPMKGFLVQEKRDEVEAALRRVGKQEGGGERRHCHRHREGRDEEGEGRRSGHRHRHRSTRHDRGGDGRESHTSRRDRLSPPRSDEGDDDDRRRRRRISSRDNTSRDHDNDGRRSTRRDGERSRSRSPYRRR